MDESLSGSDESESDSNEAENTFKENTLTSLLRKQAATHAMDPDDESAPQSRNNVSGKQPLVWFTSPTIPSNTYLGIYRAIFNIDEQGSNEGLVDAIRERQLSSRSFSKSIGDSRNISKLSNEDIGPHVFMCMIGGGHFAAMVVSLAPKQNKSSATGPLVKEAMVIAHKTFHRYTTRRKQGGSQSANDSAKGAAHSAGAGIRRYNEAALNEEVRLLLAEWKNLIDSSELLFVRATGNTNRRTLFGPYEDQVLHPNDPRLRGFPFNTRRATQKELMRSFIELTRVKVQQVDEAALAASVAVEKVSRETAAERSAERSERPAPKLSEADETAALHTMQIQAMIRRSRLPALLSYLKGNSLDANFKFYPTDAGQNFHAPSPLHLAASLNNPVIVTGLMAKASASPEILNGEGKPPFDLAGDRPTRDAFRLARSRLLALSPPVVWDWDKSHIPSPLTESDIETRRTQEAASLKKEEEERRQSEVERLNVEGPKVADSGPLGKAAGRGRALALGVAKKTAQERREEESRGLTPEMRMRLERERRARAAEERFKMMQLGSGGS